MLTEVHIGVILRIHLMIGPDPPTQFILYVFMGFMPRDEAGHGKRLTLFLAWNSEVIYVLCEALHCHAGKCQARYFARNDLSS